MNRLFARGPGATVLISLLLLGTSVATIVAQVGTSEAQTLAPVGICPGGPPVLQLANPNPGDFLSLGDYEVSGIAYDPSAKQGSGIDRVEFFLGLREAGGLPLGNATVGQDPTQPRAFQFIVNFPSNSRGNNQLVAYAISSVTSQQTAESVPVHIGPFPTATPSIKNAPTPVPFTTSTSSSCIVPAPAATFR